MGWGAQDVWRSKRERNEATGGAEGRGLLGPKRGLNAAGYEGLNEVFRKQPFSVFIQSLRAFRLALFSWFGGSGVLFYLVCLVGLVGLVCFLFCFLKWKRVQWGCFFLFLLSWFVDFWSLEVTFSMILVSLGRLWTCLVPGGPGRRPCRNAPLHG